MLYLGEILISNVNNVELNNFQLNNLVDVEIDKNTLLDGMIL